MSTYGHWQTEVEFDPNDFWGFIYEIEEISTSKLYIGKKQFRFKRKKTKANPSRTKESDWREYTSSCEPLKEAIKLQGKDNFIFRIITLCAGRSQLTYEENKLQYTRDVLRSKLPNGERKYFNKTIGHLLFAGVEKQTEASKEKMRAYAQNRTPEHKEKIYSKRRGVPHTTEAKNNMTLAHQRPHRP